MWYAQVPIGSAFFDLSPIGLVLYLLRMRPARIVHDGEKKWEEAKLLAQITKIKLGAYVFHFVVGRKLWRGHDVLQHFLSNYFLLLLPDLPLQPPTL